MSDCDDLNFIEGAFSINQEKWKSAQQISACIEGALRPPERNFSDLRDCMFHLDVESASCVRALFEVPVE